MFLVPKYCDERMQIWIYHILCDLKNSLKLIAATFERRALIGAALHTDGCCCCVADCRIAITQQFDSEPFLLSSLTPDFLNVLPIFTCCSSYFLTECVLASSTNTSESMLLKCTLRLQSLRSTCKLLMGKKQYYTTNPYFSATASAVFAPVVICTHILKPLTRREPAS